MERVLLAVALIAVAVLVAFLVQHRAKRDAPTQGTYSVPAQLDRADFVRPAAPWLVVVFTSSTCASCEAAWEKARPLESDEVAVEQVEAAARRDLHERYAIEAVPTTLVADAEGVVQASFLGPPTAADLWAAVARLR
jgi:thioredoxin-related protein